MTKKKKNDIDYSDIPETDEDFWKNATIHLPKKKQSLTIRLDAEVVEWFKNNGRGYQTHINAVLKAYMLQNKNSDKNKGKTT
jgi:uncharacterized protein (DUF4415 family)